MKRFLIIVICLLLILLACVAMLFISHQCLYPSATTGGKHCLTVMTYNTQAMNQARKQPKNAVLHYLEQTDADVLCLQEVLVLKDHTHLTLNDLKKAFARYPYSYIDFKVYNQRMQFGNVVFSKYPLFNKHTIRYDSRTNITSCCDMKVGNDTIRLFINHLESNKINRQDIDSIVQNRSLQRTRLWDKLQTAGRLRQAQARVVSDSIQASPHSVIVVGDFNDTPLSYTYWTISRGLKDCFLRTSNGRIGSTWHQSRIGLRIDYILCSQSLYPTAFTIHPTKASDHFPCQATICW